jgi:DNA-binding transcriptional LysR family regulator
MVQYPRRVYFVCRGPAAQSIAAGIRSATSASRSVPPAPPVAASSNGLSVGRNLIVSTCVQYRQLADGDVFVWPFERDRKTRRIAVDGRVMVNASDLAVRAAVDGLGIAYTIEALAEPFLRSGQLVRVLEDWSPLIQGLFLYYPGHRQVPATLRALIDMIRTVRGSAPSRRSLQNPFTKN